MENHRIEELLTEMRDLQLSHLELYREALRNQAASIEAQKGAIEYQRTMVRRVLLVLLPLIVILLVLALGTMLGMAG